MNTRPDHQNPPSNPAPAPRFITAVDGEVRCTLCAHLCRIAPGEAGICQVRVNADGRPEIPYYGELAAVHVDPVEKKPLYHFHPGARLLSIGFLGCNFRCPFCQNYSISQSTRAQTRSVMPDELPSLAREAGALGIAYTYNEPTIHFEYVMESAERIAAAGLANTLVTNGHLTRRPATELLERMDAVNVDLKSFQPDFYRDELGGSLEAVKEFITIASKTCELEVTTLLIPGKNDSDDEVDAMARFVSELSPDIPYHLSGYYPTYRYEIPATSVGSVRQARVIAQRHLNHVYTGNVERDSVTTCTNCKAVLARRHGYGVELSGLTEDRRHCASCGDPAPFRWFEA